MITSTQSDMLHLVLLTGIEGKVTPLKVNGVAATKENILDGSYIIQRPLLLVGSGDPTDVQQAFLDYVLGDEGQKTVEDMGFIPMK